MSINEVLKNLLHAILEDGVETPSRAGKTKEIAFANFNVPDPTDRYITLPERKVSVPAQIAETMWVLAGRNDVEWLSAYLPRAPEFADDGKNWRAGYGPRLRNWRAGTDQLKNVIDLLKKDPTTRRAVISLWDPETDFLDSKDIPCNNWLHFLARNGKLHLNVSTRSNDVMWGWSGINFFEWSVLLEIVAVQAGLNVGTLQFNVSSLHLYERHWEKAQKIVDTPHREVLDDFSANQANYTYSDDLDSQIRLWFKIEGEIRDGDLSSIGTMPNPLLWSWLWAIAYHWGHVEEAEEELQGTDILPALRLSPKRNDHLKELIAYMMALHIEKSEAYGDSWKKRGENYSIIPNIARKVDRIVADKETSDETKLDTAIDLVIYLAKYEHWLSFRGITATVEGENIRIDSVMRSPRRTFYDPLKDLLDKSFEDLISAVESDRTQVIPRLKFVEDVAVEHLMKLWNGPEGRALRNSTRAWNPEQ